MLQAFYSHGVRQALFERFSGTRPDIALVPRGPTSMYAQAVFCLAPSGLAFGDRLFLAIAFGCIPVIIQDNVTQVQSASPSSFRTTSRRYSQRHRPPLPRYSLRLHPRHHSGQRHAGTVSIPVIIQDNVTQVELTVDH